MVFPGEVFDMGEFTIDKEKHREVLMHAKVREVEAYLTFEAEFDR